MKELFDDLILFFLICTTPLKIIWATLYLDATTIESWCTKTLPSSQNMCQTLVLRLAMHFQFVYCATEINCATGKEPQQI